MSGMVDPCPWCGSRNVGWEIPAFVNHARPTCEDCGALGPEFFVENRKDRDGINAQAIAAWNRP